MKRHSHIPQTIPRNREEGTQLEYSQSHAIFIYLFIYLSLFKEDSTFSYQR